MKANVLFFDRRPGSERPWTKTVWVYDLRTNKHFTLKKRPMTRADLDEFVQCYRPGDRHNRVATWSEKTPDGPSAAASWSLRCQHPLVTMMLGGKPWEEGTMGKKHVGDGRRSVGRWSLRRGPARRCDRWPGT